MLAKALQGATAAAADKLYIEDVMSTYLYTGNGSTQTITNGIDLAGEGGLVWVKTRGSADNHRIYDTTRGADLALSSSTTGGQNSLPSSVSFGSTGFSLGNNSSTNGSSTTYASWTFRKAPKFFDVVTYTGNGNARTIAHNLGSVPGCIIIKNTSLSDAWYVYHRSLATNEYILLQATSAKATSAAVWNNTAPTSSAFSVGTDNGVNFNGSTFVAYLFAHDAGGFGDSGNDNVVSCGSYTGNGSTSGPTVTLGWEPQWLLIKASGRTSNWYIVDNMRGIASGGTDPLLFPNLTVAENTTNNDFSLSPTGFALTSAATGVNQSAQAYIYIAIRRGPMKTPTDATEVFSAGLYSVNNTDNRLVTTGILTDAVFVKQRNSTAQATVVGDRLRGQPYLVTSTTAAEVNVGDGFDQQLVGGVQYGSAFSSMNGFWVGNNSTARLNSGLETNQHIAWAFRRAPGFFDVVAYTGTGSARTVAHNLGVAPELIITKPRNFSDGWGVYAAPLGATKRLRLDLANAESTTATYWNNTDPTSFVFTVGTDNSTNGNTYNYIAYLFATCPGISKVGNYTGTGTTLNIDCGFTAGARFVLIKRADSTGDWYVWDTARGIIAANDPYLLLNSTAVEVTNTDYIDPLSTGFQISSTAPAAINANGGSYIYLSVA